MAAAAMVGTLPGRTQGLGLVTEPLLKDLRITRSGYAELNLWATLFGALFAIGIGRLIDRQGSRVVLTMLAISLGAVTIGMSQAAGILALSVCLALTRGVGQGALSVASQALIGKWFSSRLNSAMAAFSILLSIGFMAAFPAVGAAVLKWGWRAAWASIGWALVFGLAPLCALVVRSTPEEAGLELDLATEGDANSDAPSFTLLQALRTPAFWAVGLCSSAYGLVASGIGLFNENILAERGVAPGAYYISLAITALTSLIGNFLGGWLTAGRSVLLQMKMTAVAMLLLASGLVALTRIHTAAHAYGLAVLMGIAGGLIIVVFFAFWARAFGRSHLGRIQGVAQAMTVLGSAIGPLLLARVAASGSYANAFYALAVLIVLLGVGTWLVPAPTTPARAGS